MRRVGSTPTSGTMHTRDILLPVAVLAVPLALAPGLAQPFTSTKWHVFGLLAFGGLLAAAARGRATWPAFSRTQRAVLLALSALTLLSTLREGPAAAAEPLVARAAFLAFTWCTFAAFVESGLDTRPLRRALAASLAAVVALGLAQILGLTHAAGWEPLFGLSGSDGRSATFGNANMAAQWVGFAATLRVAGRAVDTGRPSRAREVAGDLLVAAGLVYMAGVGARSALLATGAAFLAIVAVAGRRGVAAVARPLALAVVAAVAAAAAGVGRAPLPAFASHPLKAESLRIREHLWRGTLELIRDHPLGVGAASFADAFLPRQLRDERLRSESLVYTTPHNEVLRAVAEEGVPWSALTFVALTSLALAVARRPRTPAAAGARPLIAAGAAFLAVESTFQFPFALASGALAAAIVLGLALAYVEPGLEGGARPAPRSRAWAAGLFAVGVAGGAVVVALAASDHLAGSAGEDAASPRRACALNPRNRRACLAAAWRDALAGERAAARVRAAAILDRSPCYYPAIKLLADESFAHGDARAGCFHLWIYDSLFAGTSSEHTRLVSRCAPDLLAGFASRTRVPGYERFPLAAPANAP